MLEIYSKCHNSPINGPTGTQIGWSHPIVSPSCPLWCGCHGNGRYPATTHCIFSNYVRLETERVNQFWWNLVSKGKLGPQWQSRDGRHVGKYSKCHNSPTNGPTGTQLGWSHAVMFSTCPPWCGCHVNGRWLATAHWTFSSYKRLEVERVIQFWWNLT